VTSRAFTKGLSSVLVVLPPQSRLMLEGGHGHFAGHPRI
jgi:hypothetical protein